MKKSVLTIGLMTVFTLSTLSAMAENTIYRDGIGRLHFLGKDVSHNSATSNYSNSAAQDLTRKLYDETSSAVNNDTSYDQHPLKNYENTFSDSRFTNWRKKYQTDVDAARVNAEEVRAKGTATAVKGATDASNFNQYGSTNLDSAVNVISDSDKNTKKEKKNKKNKNK